MIKNIFIILALLLLATKSYSAGTETPKIKSDYAKAVEAIKFAKKYEKKGKIDKANKRYEKAQKLLLKSNKKNHFKQIL